METTSFYELLRRHASRQGEHQALVSDARRLTYAELLQRVRAGAALLGASGVGPGAIVGLSLADEIAHLVATLSLVTQGARQVTLATYDTESSRAAVAARVRVTHIVGADRAFALEGCAFVPWNDADGPAPGGPSTSTDAATIFLKTSGTTGDMNLVEFSQAQLAAQALRHADYADERLLRLASVEYNNSKRHRLYCLCVGGTNIFRPVALRDVAAYCRALRVTCLDVSRMHLADLAARGEDGGLPGIKVRAGGSAVPIDLRRAIERDITPNFFVRYAATECGPIAMSGPGDHDDEEPVGAPLPGVDLEIVDEDGRACAVGRAGRIRLRAAGMATGYYDNVEESHRRFRDGWFWPGDMGTLRPDGQLIVHGRQDDMMILNGLNIFPAEIERVLERHAAVAAAAALPFVSNVHGQIPVAAVELRPGAAATVADLQAYARQHLALRAPRRILILNALPRNSQGKIARRQIAPFFQPATRP